MSFFANYPVIDYKFGDEILPSKFQDLSVYIDLLDQIVDDASFYEKYTILDGERPDTLSYKLYGTTAYYWTFFLLNENIRRQGWPLTFQEVYANSKLYYPHKVFKTNDTMFDRMKIGDTVIQGNVSNPSSIGKVVKRDHDNGQLFVEPTTEVRTIDVTNGGSGYTTSPTITIFDVHGDKHEREIEPASASVNLENGSITSINVIDGGSGWQHPPTVTISAPQVVDWDLVTQKMDKLIAGRTLTYTRAVASLRQPRVFIRDNPTARLNYTFEGWRWRRTRFWIRPYWFRIYTYIITETITTSVVPDDYFNLLEEDFGGYKRADISRTGEITEDDVKIIRNFARDPNSVTTDQKRRIIDGLKRPIINESDTYSNWVPHGTSGDTATATANLSLSTFSTNNLETVDNVSNWREFQATDIKTLSVNSVVDQYNAIHHYENADGEWVDIDPTDDASAALYTPITYLDRLESQNEALKEIKVLKPEVANQLFGEYQRLLRDVI